MSSEKTKEFIDALDLTKSICKNNIFGSCVKPSAIVSIQEYIEEDQKTNKTKVMKESKEIEQLECDNETCVMKKIGLNIKDHIITEEVKTKGSWSPNLLSNFKVDGVLYDWIDSFSFFPYTFCMMDYQKTGCSITEIDIIDIVSGNTTIPETDTKRKFKCAACIFNTDVSDGPGKHWVCVFIDTRNENIWTVEYFNSAGNPPPKPVIVWMETVRKKLMDFNPNVKVQTISVTKIRHQKSDTECGPYVLAYIRARLSNVPIAYFMTNRVPDGTVTEFRKYIFSSM